MLHHSLRIVICTFFLCCSVFPSTSGHQGGPTDVKGPDLDLIIDINNLTYTIANEHDGFYSFVGVRTLAMTHLAIHDILNAVDPQYQPYHFTTIKTGWNPTAAVIVATQVILSQAYPTRRDTIAGVCDTWLKQVPKSPQKAQGLEIGQSAGQLYVALRSGDGHEKNGAYTPMTKPGDYQYTPGFDWVWKPDFSVARPFVLDSVSQFRSPPPPPITSTAYAKSYNEVMQYGQKNSPLRTTDETHFAHWWAEFGEHGWNRIGRITAAEHKLSATRANRMFALINMNLYDLYLASFDAKYHYDTWRPYTAIRQGDQDNNPDTRADVTWEPEMVTPPWPEYPSAHASVGAAGAEIVAETFGTPYVSFEMASVTAPPGQPTRAYDNLDDAADDCANSRIMNGFHFRFATEAGLRQGRAVARYTIEHTLQPLQ